MIQPVSAFSPRAVSRGSSRTYGKTNENIENSNFALANAVGASAIVGGLATAALRNYTSSWAHAGVLGVCSAFLTMFFMTPSIVGKNIFRMFGKSEPETAIKSDVPRKVETIAERLKPPKRMVPFRQS